MPLLSKKHGRCLTNAEVYALQKGDVVWVVYTKRGEDEPRIDYPCEVIANDAGDVSLDCCGFFIREDADPDAEAFCYNEGAMRLYLTA